MLKRILPLGLFICFSIFLTSCTYEPLEGDFGQEFPTDNPDDPDDPDEPGDPSAGGLYWPLAMDNSWTYTDEASEPTSFVPMEGPMEVTATTTIGGEDYFLIPAFFSPNVGDMGLPEGMDITIDIVGGAAIRYEDGNYYEVVELSNTYTIMGQEMNQELEMSEMLIFKENAAAGDSWTENTTMTVTNIVPGMEPQVASQEVSYTFTILEKDVTATVNGQSFDNVTKLSLAQDGDTGTNEVWFAKDVGPIYMYNTLNPDDWYKREIQSYTLN